MWWLSFFVSCARITQPAEDGGWLWIGGDVSLGEGGQGALAHLGVEGVGIVDLVGPIAPRVDPPARYNTGAAVSELSGAGVEVVGIDNPHAGDAPTNTAKMLRALKLEPAGGVAGDAVIHIHGQSVVVSQHALPHEGLQDDLAAARAKGDLLVASFHATDVADVEAAITAAKAAGAAIITVDGVPVGPVERGTPIVARGLGSLTEGDGLILRVHLPDLAVEEVRVHDGRR
jgi:hypothetical protein